MYTLELTLGEINVIRTSLEYSKQKIAEAQGTPAEVRKDNLERVEAVLRRLPRVAAKIED